MSFLLLLNSVYPFCAHFKIFRYYVVIIIFESVSQSYSHIHNKYYNDCMDACKRTWTRRKKRGTERPSIKYTGKGIAHCGYICTMDSFVKNNFWQEKRKKRYNVYSTAQICTTRSSLVMEEKTGTGIFFLFFSSCWITIRMMTDVQYIFCLSWLDLTHTLRS